MDDDVDVRRTVGRYLRGAGYVVEEAENGKIALQSHRLSPADLIVMDIVMPDKEGLETIRELRRLHSVAPIIAVSGGGIGRAEDYLDMARIFGASRTLQKPFALADLVHAINDLLATHDRH